MADNTTLNSGSGGDTIRTDDISGVKFPISKLALGADGVDGGLVSSANPLPISDAGGSITVDGNVNAIVTGSVTVTGAVDAAVIGTVTANAGTNLNTSALALESGGNLAAQTTSLSVMDDWDESDRAKVNLIVGQAGVQGGSGAVSATTQRVVLATDVALPTGTNTVGNVGLAPRTSGGLSISRTLSAASTNATNAKGSAGQVFGWYVTNTNASPRYLKLYNKATSPTVGSDTPVMTLLIPGNTSGSGSAEEYANGIEFSTGIGYALTTGVADADTGAVAANEIIVNLFYK